MSFSNNIDLYRIFGNTWSFQFYKERESNTLLGGKELIEDSEMGHPRRIHPMCWEIRIEANHYQEAQGAAQAVMESVYQVGMEAIIRNGLSFASESQGVRRKFEITSMKPSWAEWGLSFIPFFRAMGSNQIQRFKVMPKEDANLLSQRIFQAFLGRAYPISHQPTIQVAETTLPAISYDAEANWKTRLDQEPFQDAWTQVASRVFQNHTKHYYPQSQIVSDFRLVLIDGYVRALPISKGNNLEENRRTVQAYKDFLFSEYECPIDHHVSLLTSIQYEYVFNLDDMLQKGAPLTPEHVYRVNIGVNVLSIQRANNLYKRLLLFRKELENQGLDREELVPLREMIVSLMDDKELSMISKLNVSEIRGLIRLAMSRQQGEKMTLSTLCHFLDDMLIPKKGVENKFNGSLSPDEYKRRVRKFYELLPLERAQSLNPSMSEEVVAGHFNQSIFLRTALQNKRIIGKRYPSDDYPIRKLGAKQFQLLMKVLLPPDSSRSLIYTGKEIRHTPILGYMTVDDPKDGRRLFKPWQNQQDELQIYFDQRKSEHFENWVELACHVTCKTDRTHRYSEDPNALRVGDLIPAPDTWKRQGRWYIVTAVTDDGIGNFNYCLETTSRAVNLPFVKLYRSTASDLHANNGLASLYTDLVGQAPGSCRRDFADLYDDPLFHKRTIPEEVSRWLSAQKIGLLEALKEKYASKLKITLSKMQSDSFWQDVKAGRYEGRLDNETIEHLNQLHHTIACACDAKEMENIWEKSLAYVPLRLEEESEEVLRLRHLTVLTEMLKEMRKACFKMFEKVLKENDEDEQVQQAARWLKDRFSTHDFVDLGLLKSRIESLGVEFPHQIEAVKKDLVFLRQIFYNLASLIRELPQHKIHDDLLFAGHSLGGAQAQGAMWHFLFYKRRLPLPGCYAFCYANDSPKIPPQDNIGFLKRGCALRKVLERNENFFFIYHKEDGRGDPVPESGGHHLGASPLGGKPYSTWLKVVTNVFSEAPAASLPEIIHLSAHAGRTGKAIAKRLNATQRKVEDVIYTHLTQKDLWRFDTSWHLPRDLRAVFNYRFLLSPRMTETLRRIFGRFLGLGIKTVQWQMPGLARGHRDTQGIMHIGLGQDQKITHPGDPSPDRHHGRLDAELDESENINIIRSSNA